VHAEVVNREDVRVRERRDGLRFPSKRARRFASAAKLPGSTLIATSRFSRVSRAR
jgi:hypothetical protein